MFEWYYSSILSHFWLDPLTIALLAVLAFGLGLVKAFFAALILAFLTSQSVFLCENMLLAAAVTVERAPKTSTICGKGVKLPSSSQHSIAHMHKKKAIYYLHTCCAVIVSEIRGRGTDDRVLSFCL